MECVPAYYSQVKTRGMCACLLFMGKDCQRMCACLLPFTGKDCHRMCACLPFTDKGLPA